jgi:hypothetical protein
VQGPCEHGNEPSGFIKCWKILEWLCNSGLLKKGLAPWSQLVSFQNSACTGVMGALLQQGFFCGGE